MLYILQSRFASPATNRPAGYVNVPNTESKEGGGGELSTAIAV
jgi:hypothetical protein